jgi:putative oxidoreductase
MQVSKILPLTVRFLLGALFLLFGANKLVPFIPQPPLPPEAAPFIGGLAAAGYMFPLIGAVEVVAGALLIAGRFVPLALTVLAPIIVNIAFFHVLIVPGLGMVAFLLVSELYLAWVYGDAFRGVLQPVTPLAVTSIERRDTAGRTSLAH